MVVSILGNRFNNLQSRIEAIYGDPVSGTSTTGYAQGNRSYQIAPLNKNAKNFDAASDVDYTLNQITIAGHSILDGDRVEYDANSNDPIVNNLYEDAHYWVKRVDPNIIELYYDEAHTRQVDLSSGASGIHILYLLEGNLTEADAYFRLYLDIAAARVHQVGASYTVPNNAILLTGDTVEETYITDLENLMTDVETDKFVLASTQSVLENLQDGTSTDISSTRTTAWNNTITHEFNVNFADAAARTGFFNAGGTLRFSGTLTGGSGTKTADWRNMLTNVGTTEFSRTGVSVTGTATTSAVTPYTLTTSYQLLMEKSGANYLDNRIYISAKNTGTSTITVKVEYSDLDTGGTGLPGGTFGPDPVDENVDGTITSDVSMVRPAGDFVVGGVTYNTVTFAVTGLNLQTL